MVPLFCAVVKFLESLDEILIIIIESKVLSILNGNITESPRSTGEITKS